MSNDKGTWFGWEVSKVGPVSKIKVFMELQNLLLNKLAKVRLQVKHGIRRIQNRFTILNKILGVGVEARVEAPIKIIMFEKIFKGLERAHGCTKVQAPAENGVKVKRSIICQYVNQ